MYELKGLVHQSLQVIWLGLCQRTLLFKVFCVFNSVSFQEGAEHL